MKTKKCDDKSLLEKVAEKRDEHTKASGGLFAFRKQFEEYQQAKGTTSNDHPPVSRPYTEVFVQHKNVEAK